MAVTWITPAGDLTNGVPITERNILNIPLSATSTIGNITYSVIAGQLPRGLRLEASTGRILGSATEVRNYTISRFVVRANDSIDIEDRTFSLAVDGSDLPRWVTEEGFLQVGNGENYFVLDNAYVEFHLSALDPDVVAGDNLEFYLVSSGGGLPPGLSLSKDGTISGFTDPIFALENITSPTGAFDTNGYDITYFDRPEARTNGFDTYLYDNVTFDYNEPSRGPRRLSRFYTFIVAVSDGTNEVRRIFRIWVVTEEFLRADNSIIQVDTNLFRSDNTGDRVPLWITPSYLGRRRADNYLTIFLDVYDPPSLSGVITYFLLATNPDATPSVLPPGLVLDTITGELAGRVPYQNAVTKTYKFTMQAIDFPAALGSISYTFIGDWNSSRTYFSNEAVKYQDSIYICLQENRNVIPEDGTVWNKATATAEKTFTIDIIGEIESAIEWISDSDRGTIRPNQPSSLFVEARSLYYGGKVVYELNSGILPPGLNLLSTGIIQGKVKQFADDDGPGIIRFYERVDSLGPGEDSSSLSKDYTATFDSGSTTFDRKFDFAIRARDTANFAENIKSFHITIDTEVQKSFANLYVKAFQEKQKRLEWYDFITNSNIFRNDEIYRYGDPNFGIQPEIKILVFAGVESLEAVRYVQAMSRNHYRKQIRFGEIKSAVAKDPITQEVIYEVVYVDIVDEYEKNGKSISQTVNLPDNINSRVLVSYDAIKIDSDIPLVSDRDHQRVFPNSFKNMRKRIKSLGDRDRTFLPLWMRSIQPDAFVETGYVKSLVLCYLKPGFSETVISRIKSNNFDFKKINFTIDRYVIDILDGQIEDKYLAFPQRGEKLP
jgi:hypothetical protein